ncbi:hypothetical protein chiPu_0026114, partial [Chiloscyllium punctatum]|nr:hypothetical protein [Chiloscyllium punctatum]
MGDSLPRGVGGCELEECVCVFGGGLFRAGIRADGLNGLPRAVTDDADLRFSLCSGSECGCALGRESREGATAQDSWDLLSRSQRAGGVGSTAGGGEEPRPSEDRE